MRIQIKAIIIFFLLSIIPLTIVGIIAYQNGKNAIKKNLGLSFQQMASKSIDIVDRNVYDAYRNVQIWSEFELMQEVITGDLDGRISSFLAGLSPEGGDFSTITVLNGTGDVVASSNFRLIGNNLANDIFFKQAVASKPFVEDVHFDRGGNVWILTFSFPVFAAFERDKVIGVFSADWKIDKLYEKNNKSEIKEYKNYFMMMRKDGLVISSFEESDLFKRNLLNAGLKSAIRAQQIDEGYVVERDERDREMLTGYHDSRGYGNFSGLGWVGFVTQETTVAFASIERLKIIILEVGALVILVVIVLSLIVARKMVDPIVKISRIANRVAKGDFRAKIDYTSTDEVGHLAYVFDKMIDNLQSTTVSRDYVDNIINSMVDSLVVVSPEGMARRVNQATLNMFGYHEDELIGKDIFSLFFIEQSSLSIGTIKKRLLDGEDVRGHEIQCRTKKGALFPVLFNAGMMGYKDDTKENIVCVFIDITERKMAEQQLKDAYSELKHLQTQLVQSAKMSAIGELAGGVAHELNNPLAGILGYAQYVKEKVDARKGGRFTDADISIWRKYLGYIERESQRCKTIVQNLLKFSRASKVDFEEVNINFILDETITFTEHQLSIHKVTVKKEYCLDIPPILGNANQLQQVFTNIILNAQQVMPDGGKIEIASRYVEMENRDQAIVEVEISDNGCGISEKNMLKIFDPFFTTKEIGKGTGLGLSVSYGIIKDHEGEILCKSVEGVGASFIIKLPV